METQSFKQYLRECIRKLEDASKVKPLTPEEQRDLQALRHRLDIGDY